MIMENETMVSEWADESAALYFNLLQMELLELGVYLDGAAIENFYKPVFYEVLKNIQAKPKDERRGMTIQWHKPKLIANRMSNIGLGAAAVFAIRLVAEVATKIGMTTVKIGDVNRRAAVVRKAFGMDRSESMKYARYLMASAYHIEMLPDVVEALKLNQDKVVRGIYASFRHGFGMLRNKHLPRKDIMNMALLLAYPTLRLMQEQGSLKELVARTKAIKSETV